MNRTTFKLLFGLLAVATLGLGSCEKDALGGDAPGSDNARISTREIPEVLCRDLCQGELYDFNDLQENQVVTEYHGTQMRAYEILSRNPFTFSETPNLQLRIFDTVDPDQCNTFNDDDLIFPDGTFGNVLIIQQVGKPNCANDNQKGGLIEMDFTGASPSGTVTISCLTLFDTEEQAKVEGSAVSGAIFLYDEDGNPIGDFIHIPAVTDGGAQVVEINQSGIAKMGVLFLGSGAISSICVTPDDDNPGCTYTQGYWKNHEEDWCVPTDMTFEGCDEGWLDILNTPVKGNAYYILAHQYIAAYLNVECSDADTDDIEEAYAAAGEWLASHCPSDAISKDEKAVLTGWSGKLDEFNNGLIGPGHCE